MGIPVSKLIGKSVYDQEAKLIGTVQDVELKSGEAGVQIKVQTVSGAVIDIPWSSVAAAAEIVLLKEKIELPQPPEAPAPAPTPPPAPKPRFTLPFFTREKKTCPYCGKPATWIPQYERWYCYNCQRYID